MISFYGVHSFQKMLQLTSSGNLKIKPHSGLNQPILETIHQYWSYPKRIFNCDKIVITVIVSRIVRKKGRKPETDNSVSGNIVSDDV